MLHVEKTLHYAKMSSFDAHVALLKAEGAVPCLMSEGSFCSPKSSRLAP
jgi:hypothetical protein